jgi:hypothetical protein
MPEDWRIIVLVDNDNDDCRRLKEEMESAARQAGIQTRTRSGGRPWRLVNRIVVEELESWYFGDWKAVCQSYPKVPPNVTARAPFRDPDAVKGGAWEKFEGILRRCGYFKTGLRKNEAAQAIGSATDPARNISRSFVKFREAVAEAVAGLRS